MTTHLNHIRLTVGEEHVWVEHYIDLETDATFFVTADERTELMRVDFTADCFNPAGEHIGSFRTDENSLWYFVYPDHEQKIPTPNKDLIKAEVLVFKELVARNYIKVQP